MKTTTKKSNAKRRMLFSSLAMMVVSVVALSTATYAWFDSSNSGKITNLSVRAADASGISLSTNPTTGWKTTLTTSDIEGALFKTIPNGDNGMSPISTASDDSQITDLAFYNGSKTELGLLTTSAYTYRSGSNAYFFDFFLSNSIDVELKTTKIQFTDLDANTDNYDCTSAIRIAFVQWTAEADETNLSQTPTNAGETVQKVRIYEPNSQKHSAGNPFGTTEGAQNTYGVNGVYNNVVFDAKNSYFGYRALVEDGAITMSPADNQMVAAYMKASINGQYEYDSESGTYKKGDDTLGAFDYQNAVYDSTQTPDGSCFNLQDTLTDVDNPDGAGISLGECTAGYTRISVVVWLEGQDLDCTNHIAGHTLSFNIELTTA